MVVLLSKARKPKPKPSLSGNLEHEEIQSEEQSAAGAALNHANDDKDEDGMVSLLLDHWDGTLTDQEKEEVLEAAQQDNLIKIQEILTEIENAQEAKELYDIIFNAAEESAEEGLEDGLSKRAYGPGMFPSKPTHVGDLLAEGTDTGDLTLLNKNVIWWARNRSSQLITEINGDTRRTIMNLVGQSTAGEWTKDELAARIKRNIGLTSRYQQAVEGAYQSQYTRMLGGKYSAAQAATLAGNNADRYAARLLRSRAQAIARTELMFAANNGTYLGWLQSAQTQPPQMMYKKWETAEDESVCPICGPMDNKAVALTNQFVLSNGVMCLVPPAHPNCRCTMSLVNLSLNPDRQLDIQGAGNVFTTNILTAKPATMIDSGVMS